jgi:hypothetical protein
MIKDSAEFRFPNDVITLKRTSKDKFLYNRKNHDTVIGKLISIRNPDLEMEIIPTLLLYVHLHTRLIICF